MSGHDDKTRPGASLGEATLRLADCLAAFETVASGLAHEINNPLAAIVASLRYLTEELGEVAGLLPEDRMMSLFDALEDAESGAERLRRFVRDLERLGRADDGARATVDVSRVLELSLGLAWSGVRHRARLVRDLGDVPPVRGSEALIGQAVLALLASAVAAIEEGEADRHEVRVRTFAAGRHIAPAPPVAVEPGSPSDAAATARTAIVDATQVVIEVSHDGPPRGAASSPAAGEDEQFLGLRMCEGIAASLGGALSITRHPSARGTTFRLTLPAAPASPAVSPLSPAAPDRSSAAPSPAGPVDRPPPVVLTHRARILAVDDDELVLSGLGRLLSPEHELCRASSGRDAVRRVEDGERFDLILCDLMMPGMSGMEVHAHLLALAPDQAARIVFVTGGAFTGRARRFLDEVPNRRLRKPFDGDDLRRLIRDLLG